MTDEVVEQARKAFLDAVKTDLENRFAGLTASTDAFSVFMNMHHSEPNEELQLLSASFDVHPIVERSIAPLDA